MFPPRAAISERRGPTQASSPRQLTIPPTAPQQFQIYRLSTSPVSSPSTTCPFAHHLSTGDAMRPAVGASHEPAPPRKLSISDATPTPLGISAPASFMLATEADLEQREANVGSMQDSTYGIRSIDDAAEQSGADEVESEAPSGVKTGRRPPMLRTASNVPHAESNASRGASRNRGPPTHQQTETISQPLTPISFASHAFGSSVPSSPKSLSMRSFRQSDDDLDGNSSQAIASSEDEGESAPRAPSAPPQQLVMPSLIMPSRRPFTDKGKSMGRLRVMVAGRSRVGKTSLIKSIISTCEDIVHVDASSLQSLQTRRSPARPAKGFPAYRVPNHVTEIHASTKAHPEWWTEANGSDILQRRRSVDENVLARNLCFIDTPGYDHGTSILEGMEPTLHYIEKQMRRSLAPHELSDSELLSMLSGHGSSQVDVVLYLLDHDLKPSDVEFIRQLNTFSCVIPLLAKADTLDNAAIADLKCAAVATLSAAAIPLATLPSSHSDCPTPPFTVCSSPSTDLDAMDASVLMESEYIPQLRPSDLTYLISALFDPTNIAYLKHAAACKLVAWRTSPQRAPHLTSLGPTSLSSTAQFSAQSHSTLVPTSSAGSIRSARPLALTYNASGGSSGDDRAQQEARTAHLRLAAWASSLQRSLAHERQRYEALARGERVAWLRAQLDAYDGLDVGDLGDTKEKDSSGTSGNNGVETGVRAGAGALLRLPRHKSRSKTHTHDALFPRRGAFLEGDAAVHDPLGLVRFRTRAAHSGRFIIQLAGGMGILGAATFWLLQRSGTWTAACEWWRADDADAASGLLQRLWAWIG